MAALVMVLPEWRRGHHGGRSAEIVAAVGRPHFQHRVEPALHVVREAASSRMFVGLVFVMDQRRHGAAVVGPGGGDPAAVVVTGRVGIAV